MCFPGLRAWKVSKSQFCELLLFFIIYFNCKLVLAGGSDYNKTQHTNNTHHTKQYTSLKQNTAHKTTQTIKDTLHTMNTMQI
jgi:hypothetical protein